MPRLPVALLSGSERDAASGHLFYEIKMAGALYGWTLKFDLEGPAVLKNACLEATLVHLRVLIEFLAGRVRDGRRRWNPKDMGVALQEGPFIWGFFVNEPLILL